MQQTYFMYFKLFLIGLALPLLSYELDLARTLNPNSICKTYQISLPDYPGAYNPSILPYEDGYLLSFRQACLFPEWADELKALGSTSFIGLAFLNKDFKLKEKSPQLLEVQMLGQSFSLYAEDARLFSFQDKIYLLFNDFSKPNHKSSRRLYLVEIVYENKRWIQKDKPLCLIAKELNETEKNWVPFITHESLYLIYGEDPRTILKCDLSTGFCEEVDGQYENLNWDYGIIRGGTPALQVGEEFLTFFHSSIHDPNFYGARVYFMGAYTFDLTFPFKIKAYTPLPIGLLEYYEKTSSKKKCSKKVLFPGGFVQEGDLVHLAWGKDDKMIFISTIDLKALFGQMEENSSSH